MSVVALLKIGKSALGHVVCQMRCERQDFRVVICSIGNAVNRSANIVKFAL